ncbi:MAG: hypothetical protein M3Q08_11890 [Pseudomonadota bacterium]|nr:hypothetical protein [Pseudomonadota bacterium]
MSARHLITAAIAAGAVTVAVKALRHADEARTLIGPAARATVDMVHDRDVPTSEVMALYSQATAAEDRDRTLQREIVR